MNIIKTFCVTISFIPLLLSAQDASNTPVSKIKWIENLTWDQVKQKAKQENKYIFLDCYTTWCGPCKKMDREVYTNDTVSNFYNNQFICVKIQMDKRDNDDNVVKERYQDAERIQQLYPIEGYPTFIFFSPDAQIVFKGLGYKSVADFVALGRLASTKKYLYADYDKLAADYKNGIKNFKRMPYMIKAAYEVGDYEFGRELLEEHSIYIAQLPKNKRYDKESIELWGDVGVVLNSNKMRFKFFYKDSKIIDKIMNEDGYSSRVVDRTVKSEVVDSFFRMQEGAQVMLQTGMRLTGKEEKLDNWKEPDWKKLELMLRKKFNRNCARRNVINAKVEWYKWHNNKNERIKYCLLKFKKYPPANLERDELTVNYELVGFAFDNIDDKRLINDVLMWTKKYVSNNVTYIQYLSDNASKNKNPRVTGVAWFFDSYANLLYKAGRQSEAILWEEKALDLAKKKYDPMNPVEVYMKTIEKMKQGDKTWK